MKIETSIFILLLKDICLQKDYKHEMPEINIRPNLSERLSVTATMLMK